MMCSTSRSSQRAGSSISMSVIHITCGFSDHGSARIEGSCTVARHSMVSPTRRKRSMTFEVLGVERTVVGQPGVLVEADGLDDQRVALEAADGVAEIAGRHVLAMRPSVGRNDPEERAIHIVIEEHDLARVLHDLRRRPDARDARRLTAKIGVELDLPLLEIGDLGLELGLVLREVGLHRRERRRRRAAGRGTAGDQTDRSVGLLHRPHELDATQVIPGAVEVDPAVGELRRRLGRQLLQLLDGAAIGCSCGDLRGCGAGHCLHA